MRKIIENVKLQDIETIVIENDNVSNFIVSEDGKTLSIMSNIKPENIDANYNELDKRLSDLEATMKMRVLGQISNLTSKIEKLNINEYTYCNYKCFSWMWEKHCF